MSFRLPKRSVLACLALLVGACGLVGAWKLIDASRTSGDRLRQCFGLPFEITENTDLEAIANAIQNQIPVGTSRNELFAFLSNRNLRRGSRIHMQITEPKGEADVFVIKYSFPGGGLFEFPVFNEYSVAFLFNKSTDAVVDIDVYRATTGL